MRSSVLDSKTPYERLYQRKSSYEHLRSIGCLCYVKKFDRNADKLDLRGIKAMMIGYPCNKKGYKVFDLAKRRILISRDVVFEENIFPLRIDESGLPSRSER